MTTLATGLMEAVIASSKTATIINSIGISLVVSTISASTTSILTTIKYFTLNGNQIMYEITNVLKSTDLEFTVNIVDQLVKEQEGKELNESVKRALIGVNEILELIHNELLSIKKAIEYHNTKYLSSWRYFNWDGKIETIKNHNTILIHRYKILFELLKIYNKS
jgi:hypothetical protein